MANGLPRSFLLILHKHQWRIGVVMCSLCLGRVAEQDPNAAASILGQTLSLFLPTDDLVLEISSSRGQQQLFSDWVLAIVEEAVLWLGCYDENSICFHQNLCLFRVKTKYVEDICLTFGLKVSSTSPLFLSNEIKLQLNGTFFSRQIDLSNLTWVSKESPIISQTTLSCQRSHNQDILLLRIWLSHESWLSSQLRVI